MRIIYECQICRHSVEDKPPEWCPVCSGHKVIFKRLSLQKEELAVI